MRASRDARRKSRDMYPASRVQITMEIINNYPAKIARNIVWYLVDEAVGRVG